MDTIDGPHKGVKPPKVITSADLEQIEDRFCGRLKILPGVGVLAEGLTKSTGHFHTKFDETYTVLSGTLTLALYVPGGEVHEVTLERQDMVFIPAGVRHKVIGGLHENSVLVTCSPAFVPGDETICDVLEESYGLNLAESYFTREEYESAR